MHEVPRLVLSLYKKSHTNQFTQLLFLHFLNGVYRSSFYRNVVRTKPDHEYEYFMKKQSNILSTVIILYLKQRELKCLY